MTVDPHTTDSAGSDPAESVPFDTFLTEPDTDPSTAPQSAPPGPGRLRRVRLGWRNWRRTRPFWGGLLILLGAGEILLTEYAPLRVIVHVGAEGLAGYIMPAIMLLCGVLLWVTPQQRLFYSILAGVMALGSFVTANLGGFFIGLLLGLFGSCLAFAWSPRGAGTAGRPAGGVAVPAQATATDQDTAADDTGSDPSDGAETVPTHG
ncbi:MAG TPA: DUF6114 domain-containing protein [Micromonosporaceae bacterium]